MVDEGAEYNIYDDGSGRDSSAARTSNKIDHTGLDRTIIVGGPSEDMTKLLSKAHIQTSYNSAEKITMNNQGLIKDLCFKLGLSQVISYYTYLIKMSEVFANERGGLVKAVNNIQICTLHDFFEIFF